MYMHCRRYNGWLRVNCAITYKKCHEFVLSEIILIVLQTTRNAQSNGLKIYECSILYHQNSIEFQPHFNFKY